MWQRWCHKEFPTIQGHLGCLLCNDNHFSLSIFCEQMVLCSWRYLPFVRRCNALSYPRPCLPLASPLGSCNSSFYQKLIHFHRHLIEFLCTQYLIQKEEDFRNLYSATFCHLQTLSKNIISNMQGCHSQGKHWVVWRLFPGYEDSWSEATRHPTNPWSQLCPFLSSPIKNFLLMVFFFLSHFSLSLSALQQNLLCHQLNIMCTIAKFVSPVRLWNRKLCIFFLLQDIIKIRILRKSKRGLKVILAWWEVIWSKSLTQGFRKSIHVIPC